MSHDARYPPDCSGCAVRRAPRCQPVCWRESDGGLAGRLFQFWFEDGAGMVTLNAIALPQGGSHAVTRWVTRYEAVREARESGHPIYAWFPQPWEILPYFVTLEREANLTEEGRLEPVEPSDVADAADAAHLSREVEW